VQAYVPANDTCYTLSPINTARLQASATSWNNTVVVAGGAPQSNSRSVLQYNLLTDTWTTMPPLIQARRSFSLVNLNGTLLAIGGKGGSEGQDCDLESVELFDEHKQQWELTTPLTTSRWAFAAAVIKVNLNCFFCLIIFCSVSQVT
jgi:hypothetical protein